MIFTPTLFRPCPPDLVNGGAVGKGPSINGPSSTTKAISAVFDHARKEQKFLLQLLTYLDVTRMEDEDDWMPSHGKNDSLASSGCSTLYTASLGSAEDFKSSLGSASLTAQGEASIRTDPPSPASGTPKSSQASNPAATPAAIDGSKSVAEQRPPFDRTASSSSASSSSSDEYSTSGDSGFSLDSRSIASTRRRYKDSQRIRQPTAPSAPLLHSSRRSRTRTEVSEQSSTASRKTSSDSGSSGTEVPTSPEVQRKSRLRHFSEPARPDMVKSEEAVPAVPKFVKPRIVVNEAD